MNRIDHVIYGTHDVNAAGHRFWDEFGLASYEGGLHPAYGTANRIVPLGDSYIEIMGISDPTAARMNPLGEFVLSQIDDGDRWIAWCLRPGDIEQTAERIGSVAVPGHRVRPDGTSVTWLLAGLEIALSDPPLPFFIAWDDDAHMPGRETLEHRVLADGIDGIELVGDATRLREHAGDDVEASVTEGSPPRIVAVTVGGSRIA
ncbi:MAG TPA: VOC family protein [Actinomycetota bacterium]|nr:VOC family protein [Actinomycetota bacterium]